MDCNNSLCQGWRRRKSNQTVCLILTRTNHHCWDVPASQMSRDDYTGKTRRTDNQLPLLHHSLLTQAFYLMPTSVVHSHEMLFQALSNLSHCFRMLSFIPTAFISRIRLPQSTIPWKHGGFYGSCLIFSQKSQLSFFNHDYLGFHHTWCWEISQVNQWYLFSSMCGILLNLCMKDQVRCLETCVQMFNLCMKEFLWYYIWQHTHVTDNLILVD